LHARSFARGNPQLESRRGHNVGIKSGRAKAAVKTIRRRLSSMGRACPHSPSNSTNAPPHTYAATPRPPKPDPSPWDGGSRPVPRVGRHNRAVHAATSGVSIGGRARTCAGIPRPDGSGGLCPRLPTATGCPAPSAGPCHRGPPRPRRRSLDPPARNDPHRRGARRICRTPARRSRSHHPATCKRRTATRFADLPHLPATRIATPPARSATPIHRPQAQPAPPA
jgi:hypothetical protein